MQMIIKKMAKDSIYLLVLLVCTVVINILYRKHLEEYIASEIVWQWSITLIIAIMLIVSFYVMRRSDRIAKWASAIIWSALPIGMFLVVESITGNLDEVQISSVFKNILIFYLVHFLLNLIIGNSKIALIIYVPFLVVIALVQYFVLMFRGRPFVLQDIGSFKTAMSVAGTYVYEIPYEVFLVLMISICILGSVVLFKERQIIKRKFNFILLLISVVIILIWNMGDKPFLNRMDMWDLNAAYKRDGVVLALLEGVPYSFQEKPTNYSLANIRSIAENVKRDDKISDKKPNILLVMNESFADLEYINEIESDEELLGNWKELSTSENVISGYLSMPVFGAGTANSEYEVLVGNSVHFIPSGNVAYQMNEQEYEAGMASILKQQEYLAVALHPYLAENWNRDNVYESMEFEEFLHEQNWGEAKENIRWCASDAFVYKKLIELCNTTAEPLFAFAVTMQNHGGYDWEDYESTVDLGYDEEYSQAEQYMSLIQESDLAFAGLIDTFSGIEEDTLIIMFGDHQPAIEDAFYEELYGKGLDELSFAEKQTRYVTPFIIWANYDIEEKYDVRMSSNYFGSYILELAGVELPIYNKFLLNLMEEIPIIGMGGICDTQGSWRAWKEISEEHEELIEQYKMLQYNKVYDKSGYIEEIFELSKDI